MQRQFRGGAPVCADHWQWACMLAVTTPAHTLGPPPQHTSPPDAPLLQHRLVRVGARHPLLWRICIAQQPRAVACRRKGTTVFQCVLLASDSTRLKRCRGVAQERLGRQL